MQFTENFSLRLTKEENEKLSALARRLKVKRADVIRRLISNADVQYQVVPTIASRIVAETQEEYKS